MLGSCPTRVSLQLQQGFSHGVAAVSRDPPDPVDGGSSGLDPFGLDELLFTCKNGMKAFTLMIGLFCLEVLVPDSSLAVDDNCHFADIPSPFLLIYLLKVEGGAIK